MSEQNLLTGVEQVNPLTDSIIQLILRPDHYVHYKAGQYLQIVHDHELLSYSIANAPLGAHHYELHIRHSRDNLSTQALLAEIKAKGTLRIKIPLGDCHLEKLDAKRPILFIAAGTGFAPVKAMIEQLLAEGDPRPFELYWGARSQSDLYMDERARHWQQHVRHFQYYSSFASQSKQALTDLVFEHHPKDLKDWQIVIGGPFDMVYSTRDLLLSKGLPAEHLFSDAFSFEHK